MFTFISPLMNNEERKSHLYPFRYVQSLSIQYDLYRSQGLNNKKERTMKNHAKAQMDQASVNYKLKRQEAVIVKMIAKMKKQSSEMKKLEEKMNEILSLV